MRDFLVGRHDGLSSSEEVGYPNGNRERVPIRAPYLLAVVIAEDEQSAVEQVVEEMHLDQSASYFAVAVRDFQANIVVDDVSSINHPELLED